MYLILVDAVAVLLMIGGIALVLRLPRRPASSQAAKDGADPATYARRISGTMIAAFGLAIGLMVTLFHFASQG